MDGITIVVSCFVVLLILNVPIAVSIGLSIVAYIVATGKMTMTSLATNMVTTLDSLPLMAVPFFILAGALMEGGGLSARLVNFCDSLVGHLTGGLAIVTVCTCMFFGAISGSSPATVAAIGAIMVPAMIARGYDRTFSVALIAASGMLGIIIPPSIPMVIYGVATNASIGALFLGGFGPGILCAIALTAVGLVICRRRGFRGNGERFSFLKVLRAFREAIWALMVPIIILGGIYGGFFTPTEAAAVSVVYGFLAGKFIYRELSVARLFASITSSTATIGSVLIIVGTATTLAKVFTIEKLPQTLAAAIGGMSTNALFILLIINLLLLAVGCVMETAAAIMILAPILYPIVAPLGIHIVHFGLIMVVNLGIGMLTPPVGVNLFVATGIGKVNFMSLVKAVLPFLFALITALVLITAFSWFTMCLPKLAGYF